MKEQETQTAPMEETGIILLVEDDPNVLRINRRILEREKFTVLCAKTLAEARRLLFTHLLDAMVLDIMLPDGSGLAFCREIRPFTSAPLLFLTALDEKDEIIEGLVAGGNDYITKPYDVDEFLARVRAQIRLARINRRGLDRDKQLRRGSLTLDLIAQRAYLAGEDMLLTQKEYSLLLLLAGNEGKILTAAALYQTVWNQPMAGDNRTLKRHLSALRRKLAEGNCEYTIAAAYGKGYYLEKYLTER